MKKEICAKRKMAFAERAGDLIIALRKAKRHRNASLSITRLASAADGRMWFDFLLFCVKSSHASMLF